MSEELKKNHDDENNLDDSLNKEEQENHSDEEVSFDGKEEINEKLDSEQTEEETENEQEPKSLFEGLEGKEYTYSLNYNDITNGLYLLTQVKKSKNEKIQDIIIYVCTAVSAVTALVTKNLMAIVAVCLCLAYVYFKTMKPINYRRRAARVIDARKDEYKAVLYDTGVKIIENGNEREFLYATLSYYDHKDLMLITKDGLVIILPKRYFGYDVEKIKENFKNSFKSYNE